MNHKEHMSRLEKLYVVAFELKNIGMALEILDRMVMSCAAEANKGEKNAEL